MQVCREHQQQRADLNAAKIRQQQRRRTISQEETEEDTNDEGLEKDICNFSSAFTVQYKLYSETILGKY